MTTHAVHTDEVYKDFVPEEDSLYFLPLGGSGIFGANLNLYGHDGKWLMVDCGMAFGDETTPGVDILLPDPSFIEAHRDDIAGLVLTHAHEDHIGAVAMLWRRFRCPVYATPFTAAMVKRKFDDTPEVARELQITLVKPGSTVDIGPFSVEFINMAHSIPESSALAIRTKQGTVLHTGDWKLDPDPVVGDVTDEKRLREIGDEGVLALIGDSTNAMSKGRSGSEKSVKESLAQLFPRFDKRIVVTCFASNVARLKSIAEAAAANDRQVALVGRSLWTISGIARAQGFLDGVDEFLQPKDAAYLPVDKVVLVCTGSQGERRAALSRIAENDHPEITLNQGDVVIFSARTIPGNEKEINRIKNLLSSKDIDILDEGDEFVHVSGHPYRDELADLFKWVRPQCVIPVHGEEQQLSAHMELAQKCQISKTLQPVNGMMISLKEEGPEVAGYVTSGMLAVDGKRIVPIEHGAIRARRKLNFTGSAVVTVVVDSNGMLLYDPIVSAHGLIDPKVEFEASLLKECAEQVAKAVGDIPKGRGRRDSDVIDVSRIAVRRFFNNTLGRKPQTDVHLVRY